MEHDWIGNIYWIRFIMQKCNITFNLLLKVGLLSNLLDENCFSSFWSVTEGFWKIVQSGEADHWASTAIGLFRPPPQFFISIILT